MKATEEKWAVFLAVTASGLLFCYTLFAIQR